MTADTLQITELLAGAHAALDWAFTQAKARIAEWEPAPCPPKPEVIEFLKGLIQ